MVVQNIWYDWQICLMRNPHLHMKSYDKMIWDEWNGRGSPIQMLGLHVSCVFMHWEIPPFVYDGTYAYTYNVTIQIFHPKYVVSLAVKS